MLNKNVKIGLLVGLSLLSALYVSGCSYDQTTTLPPGDSAKRAAIINDKSLTEDEKVDKLENLSATEQPSPLGPILIAIGMLSVVLVLRFVKQRVDEQKAEDLREQQRLAKIAQAKADYEATKAPKIVSKRLAQLSEANGYPTSTALETDDVVEPPRVKIAASQTAVNALAPTERGVSFFTSRPAPQESLVEMTITVGDRFRLIWATPEEADAIDAGRVPLVRAFTYRRKTLPWYEWAGYDPYIHYWLAVSHDWLWMGGKLTASWLSVDRANPAMPGYDGNNTSNKLDWERVIRPAQPGDPKDRQLLRCTNMARFIELKRRTQPTPTRSIVRGQHVPPLAIPSRPLKLHKRRVKKVVSDRHVYLEL